MRILNSNWNCATPKTAHTEWSGIPTCTSASFTGKRELFRSSLTRSLSLCWHFLGCVVQAIFHPRTQSSFAVEPTCTPSATNVSRAARGFFVRVCVCVKVCLCKCLQPVFTTLIWSPFSTINQHRNLFENLFYLMKERAKVRVFDKKLKISRTNRTIWVCHLLGLAQTWECAIPLGYILAFQYTHSHKTPPKYVTFCI